MTFMTEQNAKGNAYMVMILIKIDVWFLTFVTHYVKNSSFTAHKRNKTGS